MTTDLRIAHFSEIAETLSGKRDAVYNAMKYHSPCTATQLANEIAWDKCSVRPRLTELFQAGLVETTGERINSEHVYKFVPLAEAERRWKVADQNERETQQAFRLEGET